MGLCSSASSSVSAPSCLFHPHHLHRSRTTPGACSSSVGPPTTGSPDARFSAVSETMPSKSRWASRFSFAPGHAFASQAALRILRVRSYPRRPGRSKKPAKARA